MYSLTIENKYGERLELTNNEKYVITDIIGIDPPDGLINYTKGAGTDGSIFNSASLDNRTITITMYLNSPAEENRIALYKYLKTSDPVRVWYENESRNVYIDGYVQKMPIHFFNKKEYTQITIICTNPLFNNDVDSVVDFSYINQLFTFPFAIEDPIPFSTLVIEEDKVVINTGDIEAGAVITMNMIGAVVNPSIVMPEENQAFTLDYTFESGDTVVIDTRKKRKSVKLTHGGTTSSLIGYVRYGSTWFTLKPGDNVFSLTAASGGANVRCVITVTNQYQGV